MRIKERYKLSYIVYIPPKLYNFSMKTYFLSLLGSPRIQMIPVDFIYLVFLIGFMLLTFYKNMNNRI